MREGYPGPLPVDVSRRWCNVRAPSRVVKVPDNPVALARKRISGKAAGWVYWCASREPQALPCQNRVRPQRAKSLEQLQLKFAMHNNIEGGARLALGNPVHGTVASRFALSPASCPNLVPPMTKTTAAKTKPDVRDTRHPLDPLSEAEITAACDLLKKQKKLSEATRFAFVQLEEPAKADVLAWTPGKNLARRAAATVFDTRTGATHIGIVDLDARKVTSWIEHPTKQHPYGQPPVIIEEFFKVGDIVKTDAGWR